MQNPDEDLPTYVYRHDACTPREMGTTFCSLFLMHPSRGIGIKFKPKSPRNGLYMVILNVILPCIKLAFLFIDIITFVKNLLTANIKVMPA